ARAEAYRLQLGGYAYSRSYLERYAGLPPSADETALSHEMLRAPGLAPLRAHPARPGASVDVEDDLVAARAALEALARRAATPRAHTPKPYRSQRRSRTCKEPPHEKDPRHEMQIHRRHRRRTLGPGQGDRGRLDRQPVVRPAQG